MRKRDKLRAKRDRMWEKMDEEKSRNKAQGGIAMIIAMLFVCVSVNMCSPDISDAKSYSKSKSYSSKPAPKKTYKPKPKPRPAPKQKINLSKAKVGTGAAVVGTTAVVASNQQEKKKQASKPVVKRTTPRKLTKGYYERGNMVCKKDRYTGREKCKSKAMYYYDDVLDADDWFEYDDDNDYRPQNYPAQRTMDVASWIIWLWFMGFVVVALVLYIMFAKRKR